MKSRSIVLLGLLFLVLTARSQYANIPDSIFGSWLNGNGFSSCMTGSNAAGWQLDTTCSAVLADTSMRLPDSAGIRSVDGVQYFKRLVYFNCTGNQITSLPALPPSLVYIFCNHNKLVTLPTLPVSLSQLFCISNEITSLPALPASLRSFFCSDNRLDTLPALPTNLDYFNCSSNNLRVLPTLPTSLSYFNCNNNPDLHCLPHLNRIVQFHFDSTGITCLPNAPSGTSTITPAGIPICNAPCTFISGVIEVYGAETQLKVYPNPVREKFTIDQSFDDAVLTISDMAGRVLPLTAIGNVVDASSLRPGLYIIRIWGKAESFTGKFVKEN